MKFIHSGRNLFICRDLLIFDDRDCYYQYNINVGLIEISSNQYLTYKYGNEHQKLQKKLSNELQLYNFGRNCDGAIILSCFQESMIRIFNKTYDLLWEDIKQELFIDTIYDVKIEKDCFWVAYPTAQMVIKYSLNNKQKLLELTETEGLCYPESLSLWEGHLYICNMGSKELLTLDANNKINVAIKFEEPIWEYAKTTQDEYVKLESGIYFR